MPPKNKILASTYDVSYKDPSGKTTAYKFRKPNGRLIIEWADIAERLRGAVVVEDEENPADDQQTRQPDLTQAQIVKLLAPVVDTQRVTKRPLTENNDAYSLELTDLINVFLLMQRTADCSYDAKKALGSRSPSDGDASTQTTETP